MSSLALAKNNYSNLLNRQTISAMKVLNESSFLIREEDYTSKPVIIDTSKADVTVFKAILQEAEKPNRNNRIYTKKAIDEALHRSMIVEKLARKTWYGESNHPEEDTVKRQTRIDMNNLSHIVTKYWWEGNLLWGEIETANTRVGRDFQGLIRQGCCVSFSMRGVGGDVKKKDGFDYIDSGLFIMAYDSVPIPSHDLAYLQEILKEDASISVLNEEYLGLEPKYTNLSTNDIKSLKEEKDFISSKKDSIFNESLAIDSFLSTL